MIPIKCEEILKATNGELISGNKEDIFLDVSTDSRSIKNGDLFIPLEGPNFDGHLYITDSMKKGAKGCITAKDVANVSGKTIISVNDTKRALMDIAAYYRSNFNIPFIGITGSVGKTSTKDMIAIALEENLNVLKTIGNLNNEIGVPLTIFNLNNHHEISVLEMGMSGLGEISNLTNIVRPDIGIITNIGLSHIGNLGSKENILKAKLEILEGISENGKVLLNGDDEFLKNIKEAIPFESYFYGLGENADFRAVSIQNLGEKGTAFEIIVDNKNYTVQIKVPGVHHVYNALAAIAASSLMGINLESTIEGIAKFTPGKMRQSIILHNGYKIINDAYNASPISMESALDVLVSIEGKSKIAILGDMFELGDYSKECHYKVGEYVAKKKIDYLITIGENSQNIAQGARDAGILENRILSFTNKIEAIEPLKKLIKENDVLLVKASRGMGLEEIVSSLTAQS